MRSKKSKGKTKHHPKVKEAVRKDAQGQAQGNSDKDYYPYPPRSLLKLEFFPQSLTEGRSSSDGPQAAGGVVNIKSDGQRGTVPLTLTVTVVKTLSRTLSCVLLVSFSSGNLRKLKLSSNLNLDESKRELKAVLKLYDRRFSRGVRENYDAAPWTPEIEKDWRRFEALDEDEKPEVCVDEECDSWSYQSSGEVQDNGEDPDNGDGHGERKSHIGRRNTGVAFKASRPGCRSPDNLKNGPSARKTTGTMTTNGCKRLSPDKWTPGHREAYLQKICDKVFNAEVSVYRHIQSLQGTLVPLVYGTVQLPTGDKVAGGAKVSGVLMEYIESSFSLRNIPDNVRDKTLWQSLGEMAVEVVQDVGDCGILDEDVRLDNVLMAPVKDGYYDDDDENPGGFGDEFGSVDEDFVVVGHPDEEKFRELKFYRAVRIDFGLARVRRDEETDEDWRKARRFRDEEGGVGFVLEKHLKNAAKTDWDDRPFKFKHSHRLLSADDFDDADI